MSRLEFYGRPLVAFDPCLKEHRQIYYNFVVNRSWGHSPYRFVCPEDTGADLISTIQRQLIEFYIQKEFGKVATEPQKLIRQKQQIMVDN